MAICSFIQSLHLSTFAVFYYHFYLFLFFGMNLLLLENIVQNCTLFLQAFFWGWGGHTWQQSGRLLTTPGGLEEPCSMSGIEPELVACRNKCFICCISLTLSVFL